MSQSSINSEEACDILFFIALGIRIYIQERRKRLNPLLIARKHATYRQSPG